MKMHRLAIGVAVAAALLAFSGTRAFAQDRDRDERNDQRDHTQFDDHDQQVAREWYNRHRDHPPAGLRNEDRLSAEEEARLRDGASLDRRSFHQRTYSVPGDLYRNLPRAPRGYRYVMIGGHLVLVDKRHHVRSVIHFHNNQ